MTTKSYSKHKEFKEYSTSGTVPYTDEQFDMIKSELIPKGSKLNSLGRDGAGAGTREYHYEYKEEKHPTGKYDRKDLHTVEEFTIPAQKVPKASEARTYYYEREDRQLPAISSSTGTRTYNYENTTSSTPGYSKVKTSKVTKDLSHNVDELDSLLDDLQKDQERQLYKSGYTSDTAESSSFDYKMGTPAKAPSSGYSTLRREELASWGGPARTELRQEVFREEKTESRVVPAPPAAPAAPTAPACDHCLHTSTLSRSSTPMSKVTTTVKTYTYEVPTGQDPTSLPLPDQPDHHHTYLSSTENLRSSSTNTLKSPPAGCQHCSHCNSHMRQYRHVTSTDELNSERTVLSAPEHLLPTEPHNGHPPYGPSSYKISETSYSSQNSSQRFPPSPSPGPFPRPPTPSSGTQQPPKRLDDLLADFPEARFPTQPDGVVRRKVEVTHESSTGRASASAPSPPSAPTSASAPAPASAPKPVGGSRNVAGPAVYYPPGHTPFAKKEAAAYQASAMQGGGAYASGRGMYEYEAGSRSKEKHSETKTAVPVCLPLCCAMPCVIM